MNNKEKRAAVKKGCILQSNAENDFAALREAIIVYRAKNRMTQEEFAAACGLTKQTVWKIENGYTCATAVTIAKIKMILREDTK